MGSFRQNITPRRYSGEEHGTVRLVHTCKSILHPAMTIRGGLCKYIVDMLPRQSGNARCQATAVGGGGRCHARVQDQTIDAHWPILPLSRQHQRQRPVAFRRHDFLLSLAQLYPSPLHLVSYIVFAASAAAQSPLWPSMRPAQSRYGLPRIPTSRHCAPC